MQLVYLDESGNTGSDLRDGQQPVFALGALLVPEGMWQPLEAELNEVLVKQFPGVGEQSIEIHATDLRTGRHAFKGRPVSERLALRDAWMALAGKYQLRFICRTIEKRRFLDWIHRTFGVGVAINPYIAAFPLVASAVNDQLGQMKSLGILISDENQEVARDIEVSLRALRLTPGSLQLSQVIEKGFFVDSRKSRLLQLCDLCVFHARKKEEAALTGVLKPVDARGVELLEPLIHKGNEKFWDVMEWLKRQHGESARK